MSCKTCGTTEPKKLGVMINGRCRSCHEELERLEKQQAADDSEAHYELDDGADDEGYF